VSKTILNNGEENMYNSETVKLSERVSKLNRNMTLTLVGQSDQTFSGVNLLAIVVTIYFFLKHREIFFFFIFLQKMVDVASKREGGRGRREHI